MGKRIPGTLVVLALLVLGCVAEKPAPQAGSQPMNRPYHRITKEIFRGKSLILPEEVLPVRAFPPKKVVYGGTISHHDITWVFLDAWFQSLKSRIEVKTFVIIAPDHFDKSSQYLSLSSRSWVTAAGEIRADSELVETIRLAYEIEEDPEVFNWEHGIREIIPYIIKYFPQSRVVPIIQKEHFFRASKVKKLVDVLKQQINQGPGLFVIASVDFSHYKNLEQTQKQDEYADYYLKNQWSERLRFPVCDNMAGLFVLNQLALEQEKPKVIILGYSDSFKITGNEPDNVTSYFFSFYSFDGRAN